MKNQVNDRNNIDGDYMWDRSGEPDPEIQKLEQLMGTLRYQPRALEIPVGVGPDRKRNPFPRLLAIAATLALMLLGAGLWFRLASREPQVAHIETQPALVDLGKSAVVANRENNISEVPSVNDDPVNQPIAHKKQQRSASDFIRPARKANNSTELAASEREEAAAAKAQLMLALRVASSKLNFAQKKAQEINSENVSHNQHKIG